MLCLFSKRLEKDRFVWPSAADGRVVITPAQLAMLLEQLTLHRYVYPVAGSARMCYDVYYRSLDHAHGTVQLAWRRFQALMVRSSA